MRLASLLILASATICHAGEVATADLLAREAWGARAGTRVTLARVKLERFDLARVRVAGLPAEKLPLDRDRHPELARELALWRAEGRPLDRTGRQNVRIEGVARDDRRFGRVLDVERVRPLPSDLDELSSRLPEDAAERLALAKEALRRHAEEARQEDLEAWGRRVALDALRALPAPTTDAALERARQLRDIAGVPSAAVTLLGARLEKAPAEDRARILDALEKEHDATTYRGRWVTRDELKTATGFVRRNGRWIRRERAELEAVAAEVRARRDLAPRKFMGPEYEAAAREGRFLAGMFKPEATRVRGMGFPVAVDRFEERTNSADVTWEQWVMANGTRLYFARWGRDAEPVLVAWKR